MRKFENGLTEKFKLKADMRAFLKTDSVTELEALGYELGTNGSYAVQVAEVDGVAVFAKPTRVYGIFGVIVIMIGALYTHLTNNQPDEIYAAIFMLFLAISTIILIGFEAKIDKGEIKA